MRKSSSSTSSAIVQFATNAIRVSIFTIACFFSSELMSQERKEKSSNPFDTTRNIDPFGVQEPDSDPNGKNASRTTDDARAKDPSVLEKQLEQAEAFIFDLNTQLKKAETWIKESRSESETRRLESNLLRDLVLRDLAKRLNSDSPEMQLDALESLNSLIDLENRVSATQDSFHEIFNAVSPALGRHLDSENVDVRLATIDFLSRTATPLGVRLGFQPATESGWKAIESSIDLVDESIREYLLETQPIDFFDDPLETALDIILGYNALSFSHHHTIDLETPINFRGGENTIRFALEKVLAKCDLDYRIRNGDIEIWPAGSPDLEMTLTYNIRGLLTETVDVDQLIENLKASIPNQKVRSVFPVDDYRIRVIATERQHREVAKSLASLKPVYHKPSPSTEKQRSTIEEEKVQQTPLAFGNRVLRAIQDSDLKTLANLIELEESGLELAELREKILPDLKRQTVGLKSFSEVRKGRRDNQALLKIREINGEVFVLVVEKFPGGFRLVDLQSPNVGDYEALEIIPAGMNHDGK